MPQPVVCAVVSTHLKKTRTRAQILEEKRSSMYVYMKAICGEMHRQTTNPTNDTEASYSNVYGLFSIGYWELNSRRALKSG